MSTVYYIPPAYDYIVFIFNIILIFVFISCLLCLLPANPVIPQPTTPRTLSFSWTVILIHSHTLVLLWMETSHYCFVHFLWSRKFRYLNTDSKPILPIGSSEYKWSSFQFAQRMHGLTQYMRVNRPLQSMNWVDIFQIRETAVFIT